MPEFRQWKFHVSCTRARGVTPLVRTNQSHSARIFAVPFIAAAVVAAAMPLHAEDPPKRLTGAVPAQAPLAASSTSRADSSLQQTEPRQAETPPARPKVRYTDGRLRINRPAKTLGGVQLWGDELWYRGWRIQRNVATGHCRLLDPDNRREDWGSFERCQATLERIKLERNLPPLSGRAVILLHGLGGWHSTMNSLASYIEDNGPFLVVNVTYPSTRADLTAHARQLASVIDHLQGVEELNFVCHSLGNVVLRRYLKDQTDRPETQQAHPPIKRIVMLAPPNHGSERAGKWSDSELFVAVLGASALQLGSNWSDLEKQLAVPQCEFGIIAGGRGDDRGYSSRLPGDDDNTISVATTRLDGARDFTIVPVWHSFLLFSPTVQRYTLQFLEHGYFTTESQRNPIAAAKAPERR